MLDGCVDGILGEVERDDVVVGVTADPVDHVAAHLAQPHKADLHQLTPL